MFRRLTGKTGKGMVSRADVNVWVKEKLESFLTLGSPTTEEIDDEPFIVNGQDRNAGRRQIALGANHVDPKDINVDDMLKQNELLLDRVNFLQNKLDKIGR